MPHQPRFKVRRLEPDVPLICFTQPLKLESVFVLISCQSHFDSYNSLFAEDGTAIGAALAQSTALTSLGLQ